MSKPTRSILILIAIVLAYGFLTGDWGNIFLGILILIVIGIGYVAFNESTPGDY